MLHVDSTLNIQLFMFLYMSDKCYAHHIPQLAPFCTLKSKLSSELA